jgi:hypothetical protein
VTLDSLPALLGISTSLPSARQISTHSHTLFMIPSRSSDQMALQKFQLKANNYSHIPTTAEVNGRWAIIQKNVVTALGICLRNLMTLSNFRARWILTKTFFFPLSVETDATPTNLQMTSANFQSYSTLSEKFCDSSLIAFYSKCVPLQKNPSIRKETLLMLPLFGSNCSA